MKKDLELVKFNLTPIMSLELIKFNNLKNVSKNPNVAVVNVISKFRVL